MKMVTKKTVYDCINLLMFNGKTISNAEFFKGRQDADKLWQDAINVVTKTLMKWAEDKAINDTMFREVTEDCKNLSGVEHRYITTNLYNAALEITLQRLENANKPKIVFERPAEPSHGKPISRETNIKYIIPWWRRVQLSRPGTIMENMPTEEQINWLANKLQLDANKGDDYIVIKCFLNDYIFAKKNQKTLLTKIAVVDGKATLSYVGG